MRERLKPGVRVRVIGPSKYEGLAGTVSQVNLNRSGTITYFVALDTPIDDGKHTVYEIRAGSQRVQVID